MASCAPTREGEQRGQGQRHPTSSSRTVVGQAYATRLGASAPATVVIVGAVACGLFVIAGRFARDPQWRGWVAFSVICGLLTLTFMACFGAGQNPQSMFADSAGPFERLVTNVETVWEVALLVRVWAETGFLRPNEGV